ncbi:MAG: Virulence factor Mce family protein [Solirubrobacterales bacterium]|nr:Virulence factor Mce family protein [Solirubrobacterales bacterium]
MSRRLPRTALVALFVAALATLATLRVGDGGDGYRIRVQAGDAAGLRKNFLVKIAGAPVGKVVDVQLDKADHAVAVLQLDEEVGPIGTDARAAVRASNLLGEKYVDLTPGNADLRPASSGFEIPRARTTTPSDLDDVLSVLDADTRVALSAFLVSQGQALVGRGRDLGTTLLRLPPTLDAVGLLVNGLALHNRALGQLVERSDRILATAAPQRSALGRLVASADGAFGSLASRRTALGQTVQRAPGAIRQLRSTLVQLERTAVPLRPAARGLKATAQPLTATLRALPAFTAAARPTLRTARSVAPTLERLGRQAAPVVIRLRPAAASLRTFATALRPVSSLLDNSIGDTLGVMQGWARAIQNRDNVGHVFRVSVELGGDAVNTLNQFVKSPPARSALRRPAANAGSVPGAPTVTPAAPERRLPQLSLPKVIAPKLPLPNITAPGQLGSGLGGLLDYLMGR